MSLVLALTEMSKWDWIKHISLNKNIEKQGQVLYRDLDDHGICFHLLP
jgi:hypothetical protein